MGYAVNTTMQRTVMVFGITEVLALRRFLILRNMNRVINQFTDAFILGSGNGDDRNAEHLFHAVDVNRAAVAGDFIHHVQGDDCRNTQLKHLHGQVKVAVNIRGVNDVDNRLRFIIQNKIAGYQFLTAVRRQGVDTRQVGNRGIRLPADRAVDTVNGNAREVADVLVGAGQLIEQCSLATVLVADERVSQ